MFVVELQIATKLIMQNITDAIEFQLFFPISHSLLHWHCALVQSNNVSFCLLPAIFICSEPGIF